MTIPKYFRVEPSGDTLVLSTVSNIDGLFEDHMQEECDALLNEVAQRQAKHAVIDLGSLDYFGSLMLQLLVVVWKRLDAMGGKLVVCNVSSVGKQVLETTKLDSIWEILPSREEALAAVQR
jgi:anti-anti-sigma factor